MARRPPKKNSPNNHKQTLSGILRMNPRGFGFVVPDDPSRKQDIFIPKHLVHQAVDGDQVEVAVSRGSKPEKGPEGEIISILNRGRETLTGIVEFVEKNQAMVHIPIFGEKRPVLVKKEKKTPLKAGDRITLKVVDWGDRKHPILGEIKHFIGHISDASCDISAAIEEYQLRKKFPKEVIAQAKTLGSEVKKEEIKGRLDLTETPCMTIDPETAKDFDDALSISKDQKGHFFLGVHIADVAHYVQADSPLDNEAKLRANSTYFPGECIPMLPEELSNNLCSLRQGVVRLTVSVLMEFDSEGTLLANQVKRSYIKSKKRFTYEEAKEILEENKQSPYQKPLKQMSELCELLKKKRNSRGSIDFALPELILILDKKGNPTGVKIEEYHIAHQLVEEFMLKANEVVAKHLHDREKELLFRIHEEPEGENLDTFFNTARSLGFQVPPKPTAKDLQSLFDQASKTPFSQQLAVGFIRTLKLAIYSPQNVGHYGLALEHYCHFTSPIRRYSDLVIQRLIFDEEEKDLDLKKIAQECSEKERISFRAEMGVKSLKKHRLLKRWMEENPKKNYQGYITKIKPFGIYFEIRKLFLEGFIHISELGHEYFYFDPKIPLFEGETTGQKFLIGQEISLCPTSIDLIHMEVKWELK